MPITEKEIEQAWLQAYGLEVEQTEDSAFHELEF
jgi:hypothetical protein